MASSNHHVGMRVSDLERAAKFYEDAFGATRMCDAFGIDGELAEMVTVGPKGVAVKLLPMSFEQGGAIELFEFTEPRKPMVATHASEDNLMHYAIQVEDTDAALVRAEAAGATRIWPEVLPMGKLRIVYVTDPDGNVIEILDGTMDEVIELIKENF
jgi:catechol 2,3-dioxygenase-like lactoylglutathione lyase family enzyme